MRKGIKILAVFLIVFTFFVQNSYAFWGRKKTTKKSEPKIQKEEPQEKEGLSRVQVKERKQKIKKEEKIEETKQKAKKTAPVEKETDKKEKNRIKKLKLERDRKRKQLNNTKWNITLNLIGVKGRSKQDMLIFEENRFYAEKTSKEGFNATNYTLSLKEDGVTVWETMQTAEEGRVNFWRGEIAEDMKSMRGIVSKQLPDGTTENYSFHSQNKSIINR